MENRKSGCFGPVTCLFLIGCLCLLAAGACFYRYYSILSTPGSPADFGISVLCGIGLSIVGIGTLGVLLIILVAKSIFMLRMNVLKMKKSIIFDFATRIKIDTVGTPPLAECN